MQKSVITVIIIVVALLLIWLIFAAQRQDVPLEPIETGEEVTPEEEEVVGELFVVLKAQNDFGISGSAFLTETEEGINVVLDFTGASQDVMQPAHIHYNTCENIGAVLHALESPLNGYSETVLETSFADLMANSPLSINVHKSAEEAQVYVACGNLQ